MLILNITYKGKKIKQSKYDEWKNIAVEWYYLILNKKSKKNSLWLLTEFFDLLKLALFIIRFGPVVQFG